MESLYSPQSRAERLIAAGRVVLAVSSLFAVWLDPSEPSKYVQVAYTLLGAYVVYAAAIAILAWRADVPFRRQGIATHVLDLAFFTLFIYFTAGPASPFTTYFVFALVCATVRWQWRGALWTAVASLAAFLGLGLYFALVLDDPLFQLYPLIVRGVYLAVIAVLLGYLGVHEERTRRDMSLVAASLQRSLEENATTEERIRLARDLHDGVLQSFTGIGLRLEALRRLLEEDPPAAREALEALQRLISSEQRDLRFFIQELKPPSRSTNGDGATLAVRIGELVQRMELEWGLRCELRAEDLDGGIPDALAREVYLVVREALVNAVRHGEASAVRVTIALDAGEGGGRLNITVEDNGRGFPAHGRWSHSALAAASVGPRTLRERVTALHGTLALESSPSGARLEIVLPAAGEAA